MILKSLSWRIGLSFAAFVLIGSIALVFVIDRQVARENELRFAELARTNAAFLARAKLPPSPYLDESLEQVLGCRVDFVTTRSNSGNEHPVKPADGTVYRREGRESVSVRIDDTTALVLSREVAASWTALRQRTTLSILATFWLLSGVSGWLIGRGMVQPLKNLAAQLPRIESREPLALDVAQRKDEIGDVARAFVATRRALQEERDSRERAEKLAVLGRMTTALAHEIQNPVAAIAMHAQLWKRDAGDQRESSVAERIELESRRIDDLLSQWLFLARPEPPASSSLSIAALVEQCIEATRAGLDHARVAVTFTADDAARVRGDAKRLSQVFRNLIVNAIQAMPRGGQLDIAVRSLASDGIVAVTIADTGVGFSETALARFAEFFFTEREGGMGIGLSVASEIVRAHGGELRVHNLPSGGACVMIELPHEGIERGIDAPRNA
ncbi:MAG: HAMP domain-containing histidine kinase [Planctomycetes bacterium]|nr:HAMP domain-containing histidine kinase [Planctomycetota bacterium]MCB9918645.1 HAMP domain-containing histidine kinase [Planctomycetota bacterium]